MVNGVQGNVILRVSRAKISEAPPRASLSVLAQGVEPGNEARRRLGLDDFRKFAHVIRGTIDVMAVQVMMNCEGSSVLRVVDAHVVYIIGIVCAAHGSVTYRIHKLR